MFNSIDEYIQDGLDIGLTKREAVQQARQKIQRCKNVYKDNPELQNTDHHINRFRDTLHKYRR